jgi:hypothetical protein
LRRYADEKTIEPQVPGLNKSYFLPMTRKRSHQPRVNWKKLYKDFSAPICSTNCGNLCAPKNNGVPYCCIYKYQEPVLFTEELAWLETRTSIWRQMPITSQNDRRRAEAIEDYIKYAHCKGIVHCKRQYRSLACRFFPLEPYFEPGKKFVGLVYMYRAQSKCPIIAHPSIKISQTYINQAIKVWKELFVAFPRELECYIHNSRGLRASMRRKKRKIRVFTGNPIQLKGSE